MKTIVYVDGFNLYYGALKGTPFKWLNLDQLCCHLLPKSEIVGIKYFTALVNARPNDLQQPIRQQIYLRALQTLPHLEIIYGHFLAHEILMPRADDPAQTVKVLKTEEKGSDVNLAAHLVNDGHLGRYETAVLITNDSGPLQLALTQGVPTVSFFGPETPVLYGPQGGRHRILYRDLFLATPRFSR